MRALEPLLRRERAKRLRRMTRRESLAVFKGLCQSGRLPSQRAQFLFLKSRLKTLARVRQAFNKLG